MIFETSEAGTAVTIQFSSSITRTVPPDLTVASAARDGRSDWMTIGGSRTT
jgi:hypothetical protein